MKIIFFTFCLLLHVKSVAQIPLFQKGDKVAFVGNSITNNGEFHHNIFQYYVTRFPEKQIEFFNCGISGDRTEGILSRMDEDILIHKPTHAVIMIGMNDVQRTLYSATPTQNADILKQRAAALAKYKINLDSIVRLFLSKNIKVILQKPTIYDQTAVLKTPNNLGVNDALKQCADYGEELAQKYKLPSVDYWTILNTINLELQKKDPSATIIGADRVHPAAAGHLIMAYQFLKSTLTPPQYISQILIKKNRKKSQKASKNCTIEAFSKNKQGLNFTAIENALPFTTVENQKQGLDLVPFVQDFNVEELSVMDLKKGNYQLVIDTSVIGTFTAEQLNAGINLALYTNTPQYQQALAVRKVLTEMWKNETKLRTIKWVEIMHLTKMPNKGDLDAVKTYLDKRFAEQFQQQSNATYYKDRFAEYVLIKNNEAHYKAEKEEQRLQAYQLAQPKVHIFQLQYLTK
jgi:lysophospholipase L1-like esterase